MKKRRIAIIAFLLCATLVMGIGFATIVDTLSIMGRTSYRPSSMVHGSVASAIHFDTTFTPDVELDTDTDNIYPVVVASVDEDPSGLPNSATFNLTINGTAGKMDYSALAVYKVVYDGTDTHLPEVDVEITTTLLDAASAEITGFTADTKLVAANGVTLANFADATEVTSMNPGDEAYAYVLINIHFDDASEVPAALTVGNLVVTMNFDVPDAQ